MIQVPAKNQTTEAQMQSTIKLTDPQMIGSRIRAFFSDEDIEMIARETGFVQRRSRLGGRGFLKAIVFGFMEQPKASLNQLAEVCQDGAVQISPQGIDQRINSQSVVFLQRVFSYALQVFQNEVALPLAILKHFSAIYVVDSSVKRLPDEMQAKYAGCGGDGPKASLKLQVMFDFLRGNFHQVAVQAGRSADQAYRDYLLQLAPGSLTIVDLGYFCLDAFQTIIARQAYFLCRYLYPTALLTPNGERMDLCSWLRDEKGNALDVTIALGCQSRHHLPCRLIALRVLPSVAEQRRRKATERARIHGTVPTREYLFLLGWTLFLTNIPAQWLSLTQVALLYRVRWQIELIFKLWKSDCGLNAIGPWRSERILTELYAKLIGALLLQFLLAPQRIPEQQWANRETSSVQVRLILARFASRLHQNILNEPAFFSLLQQIFVLIDRFGLRQKRVRKPNLCHRLASALA